MVHAVHHTGMMLTPTRARARAGGGLIPTAPMPYAGFDYVIRKVYNGVIGLEVRRPMRAIYQPRGMALEYAPLACNTYRGCAGRCQYCFGPSCLFMSREGFHGSPQPRPGIIDALRREAPKYRGTEKRLLLCFTCDPYQPIDDEYRLTRQALEILIENEIPSQVLTKGGLRASRDFDLLQAGGGWFATSLVFLDDTDRQYWEPGAASVSSRVEAIQKAHDLGIHAWVSVEPVIDPQQALDLIHELSPIVDGWKVGKLNHHPHAKLIDWRAFTHELVAALEATGREFLIKDSLQPYLPSSTKPGMLPMGPHPLTLF